MKKYSVVKLLCALVAIFTLATVCSAAGFTKTNTYADGTFDDVKSTSWYAKEVASAYELGFMNGKAEGKFAPDGNVTVAEAITMASRVHSIYNGKEIAKTEGKWYDMYVQYALANGIIAEGQYTNYDRNIMRYEMAVMFSEEATPLCKTAHSPHYRLLQQTALAFFALGGEKSHPCGIHCNRKFLPTYLQVLFFRMYIFRRWLQSHNSFLLATHRFLTLLRLLRYSYGDQLKFSLL